MVEHLPSRSLCFRKLWNGKRWEERAGGREEVKREKRQKEKQEKELHPREANKPSWQHIAEPETYQGSPPGPAAHGLVEGGAADLQLLQVAIRYPDVRRQGQPLIQVLHRPARPGHQTSEARAQARCFLVVSNWSFLAGPKWLKAKILTITKGK